MTKTVIPFAVALSLFAAAGARASAVQVLMDHSARLPVAGAASVIVGNPQVADVTVVDSRTVYVSGHAAGSTNVIVLDRVGRPVFSGDVDVVRSGSPVAVYRGVERTDFTCAENCAKAESPADANPFTALLNAAATRASASAGNAVGSTAHP